MKQRNSSVCASTTWAQERRWKTWKTAVSLVVGSLAADSLVVGSLAAGSLVVGSLVVGSLAAGSLVVGSLVVDSQTAQQRLMVKTEDATSTPSWVSVAMPPRRT
jgi:hypothetical protein